MARRFDDVFDYDLPPQPAQEDEHTVETNDADDSDELFEPAPKAGAGFLFLSTQKKLRLHN